MLRSLRLHLLLLLDILGTRNLLAHVARQTALVLLTDRLLHAQVELLLAQGFQFAIQLLGVLAAQGLHIVGGFLFCFVWFVLDVFTECLVVAWWFVLCSF